MSQKTKKTWRTPYRPKRDKNKKNKCASAHKKLNSRVHVVTRRNKKGASMSTKKLSELK